MNRVQIFEQQQGTNATELDRALGALRESLQNAAPGEPTQGASADHEHNAAFLLAGLLAGARDHLQLRGNETATYDHVLLGESTNTLSREDLSHAHQAVLTELQHATTAMCDKRCQWLNEAASRARKDEAVIDATLRNVTAQFQDRVQQLQLTLQETINDGGWSGDEEDNISDERLQELEQKGAIAPGAAGAYCSQRDSELQLFETACNKINELRASNSAQMKDQVNDHAAAALDEYMRGVVKILGTASLDATRSSASLMHNTYKHLRTYRDSHP